MKVRLFRACGCLLAMSVVAVVAVVTACRSAAVPAESDVSRGVSSMIELEVTPETKAYIQGEEVAIRVRIVNHGKKPFELPDLNLAVAPQPVLTLQAPGEAEARTFAVGPQCPADSAELPGDLRMLTIAPGESYEEVMPLDSLTRLAQTGEYSLSAALNWNGVKSESAPRTFTIDPLSIAGVHVGFGVRPMESGEGEFAWIQAGASGRTVYAAKYREMRPSIAEAKLFAPIRRAAAGDGAELIGVPRRNTPFFDEMIQWLVWQEGNELKALSTVAEAPVSFKLPKAGYRCVLPPLKVFEGPLDVFAVDSAAGMLALVRFAIDGGSAAGGVLWEAELPKPPGAITAALGPADSGSARHVVFVEADDDGFDIYHARCESERAPETFQSIRIAGSRLLGSCAPAVYVESDGTTIVGLLATAWDSAYAGSYIEVKFAADGTPGQYPGIAQLGYFPNTPQAAAILLTDKGGVVARRDAVIDFGDAGIFKMGPEGGLVPVAVAGMLTHPMLLAPGKGTSYILYASPDRGLYLEAI